MKNLWYFLIILTLSSMTCKKETENCHYKISFKNSSSKDIYVRLILYESTPSFDESLYATTLNGKLSYRFLANNGNSPLDVDGLYSRSCIENNFDVETGKNKIFVLVFDAKQIEGSDHNKLAEEKYCLKIYEFTLANLREMNWSLEYTE